MSAPKITSPTVNYNRATNGSAQYAVLVRGDATNPKNILARCSNVNWNVGFGLSDTMELNTSASKETVYGRQDLVSGQIGLIMTLDNNDQLPTSRTLKDDDAGMTLLIESGDDSPLTTLGTDGKPKRVVTDVFIGVKVTGFSGGVSANQLRMTNMPWAALDRMSGAEWKLKNASAEYPATVAL